MGHTFPRTSDGIPNLLPPAFVARLGAIARYRDHVRARLPIITDYDGLPYNLADAHFEWRARAQSADMVLRYVKTHRPATILEIGGWNGWLTHHLARYAHVLSVDFFADDVDGLGAMRHYQTRWERLQMDITDLSILADVFDMVVINNGIHFLPDPIDTIRQAQRLVGVGGVLMVLELPFYRDPRQRIRQVQQLEAEFRAVGGSGSLFLYPTNGYLDGSHRRQMRQLGVTLRPYPRYKALIRALISPFAPLIMSGVWHHRNG